MKDALMVFRGALRCFRRFPCCILPLLLAWCGYAAVTLWLRFGADLSRYTAGQTLALAFGIYFLFWNHHSDFLSHLLLLRQSVLSGFSSYLPSPCSLR